MSSLTRAAILSIFLVKYLSSYVCYVRAASPFTSLLSLLKNFPKFCFTFNDFYSAEFHSFQKASNRRDRGRFYFQKTDANASKSIQMTIIVRYLSNRYYYFKTLLLFRPVSSHLSEKKNPRRGIHFSAGKLVWELLIYVYICILVPSQITARTKFNL